MYKASVHTFQGGMMRDLDKSLVTKERYLDAHDFRLLTSTGESTGALENIEGNNLIYPTTAPNTTLITGDKYVVVKGTITYNSNPYTLGQTFTAVGGATTFATANTLAVNTNAVIPASMYVVGSTYIRDTVVLFLTDGTSAAPTYGHSMIVKFTITDSTEQLANYSVVYDDYDNDTIYRLRFSTANPIRAVGIYESSSIQKVYWVDGYNNVRYANIASYLTTDGLVKSGSNHYFPVDMFEFIPESGMTKPVLDRLYPGAIKAGTVQYTFQYFTNHGSVTMMSPLSNTIHITTDDDYQASSYYYKGEGDLTKTTGKSVKMTFSVPDSDHYDHIRIIRLHYTTINSVPTITIVGEVPITSLMSTVSYLDNGNTSYGTLTLDEFNLGETELFSAKDIALKNNRLFTANIKKEEFSIGEWDARAVRFIDDSAGATLSDSTAADIVITNDLANWAAYTPTYDGINQFNDPANDGVAAKQWKFQKDGITLGAEGPHVVISFVTDLIKLDAASSGQVFGTGLESTSDNKSFTSFASPYMSGRRSWQRDETYRLYIVFFNAHGIASPAKWICDLRMPSLHDTDYSTLGTVIGSDVYTTALYPAIKIDSFPTGAVSAQLLRVERGGDDRSILTQAAVIPTGLVSAAVRPEVMSTPLSASATNSIVKLVSPEINITKNISKGSSDYLEYVTYFTPQLTEVTTIIDYYKYITNTLVAFDVSAKAVIGDTLYVEPRTDTFSFNATTCANYDSATHAYGCSGLFVHHHNASWLADGNSYVVVNYKRDVHASQYGGQTFEAREGNIAIPCSDIISDIPTRYTAWNGDTFINFFEASTQLFDLTKTSTGSLNENIYVPLESSINCELRHDRSASKSVLDNYPELIQEVAGEWTNGSGNTYSQETSLYQYNTVYSQDSTAKFYINTPASVSTDTEFDCMIRASKVKINGESQDSFTLFPINDFIEIATNKGAVTTLLNINDKLLFWQENAVGILSVNERSLIQDSGGAALVLGTGGVLDRYDYISDSIGAASNQHVIATQTGVYWIYTKDRSMYRYTQNLQNVTKSKLIQSWIESQLTATSVPYNIIRMIYDAKYNQVLTSFYNTNTAVGLTLVFDETIDAFSGFYDYYTKMFIPYRNGYLSTAHLFSTDLIFYHNSLLKERCCFYSEVPSMVIPESTMPTPKFVDSTVKLVFNEDYGYTKVFDDFAFVSTSTINGIEVYNNTFNYIRCYNNYQNTDYCILTYGTNLERDEREWTTFIPRNAVNKAYTTSNLDIFDAANITKSRTFKERIRDKYMITDFKYTNTANRRFVVPYITVKYRISPR